VAIWLPNDDDGRFEPVAHAGQSPEHVEMIPLTYQQETIGQLAVAPREANGRFTRQEQKLLASIAALTANTVRAVQLSDELRQSRQRIVTAREEERRRLRRDLHDGLGPQLASQTLGLEAVDQLLESDPVKAHQLLASLKQNSHEAISDVRRLVYDLRPPTLDDLGLVGALQQSAARLESNGLRFVFEVEEPLPELPAAVETAVYRIVQEALTNVARHAHATRATVTLQQIDHQLVATLVATVEDNGVGLAAGQPSGVGLQSMQERAAELNGRFLIASTPKEGTKVSVWLPLRQDEGGETDV
jgi:signal transduction histidine kinase